MTKEIVIKQKNSKQFLLFIGAMVMTALGGFLWFVGVTIDPYEEPDLRAKCLLAGPPAVVFFGFCLIYIFYRLIHPKPLLTLTEKGFRDSSSLIAAGFVPWKEVSDIRIVEIARTKLVSITLFDQETFLKTLPALKRWVVKINISLGYGPVCLNLVSAQETEEDILHLMQEIHEEVSQRVSDRPKSPYLY